MPWQVAVLIGCNTLRPDVFKSLVGAQCMITIQTSLNLLEKNDNFIESPCNPNFFTEL
jgi:hypothetical protein